MAIRQLSSLALDATSTPPMTVQPEKAIGFKTIVNALNFCSQVSFNLQKMSFDALFQWTALWQ
jgi:hypothetical protein